MDNQSVDRAYRIGQRRNVVVYRLMTAVTVDEVIYRRQVRWRAQEGGQRYRCRCERGRGGGWGGGCGQVFKGSLMKIATEEKDQLRYFADIVSGMCLYGVPVWCACMVG